MVLVSGVARCFFGFRIDVFKMSKNHTKRIMGYKEERQLFLHFFDIKAYIIMAVMIGGGIGLRAVGVFPDEFAAFFYTGLGCALALAGVLFIKNFITYRNENCECVQEITE